MQCRAPYHGFQIKYFIFWTILDLNMELKTIVYEISERTLILTLKSTVGLNTLRSYTKVKLHNTEPTILGRFLKNQWYISMILWHGYWYVSISISIWSTKMRYWPENSQRWENNFKSIKIEKSVFKKSIWLWFFVKLFELYCK